MSRAARVRAWLIAAGGMRSAAEVSDGLGATGKERQMVAWTIRTMVQGGQLVSEGMGRGMRYQFVQPPTRAWKLTPEERKAKRAAMARARHKRDGGLSREELAAAREQRHAALQAESAQRRAAREARFRDLPYAKQRAAERKRLARHAAGRMTRAEWLAKVAAGKQERARAPRPAPTRLQRVGSVAGMTPKPVVVPSARPAETVEQFLARGGAVDRLPGIQAAPAPRTIPTWRSAA
ncbi:hypothetical protein OCJ37_14390 [Xanthomonas sp. AM6]|uniref:hypothetical protein n=1 Tax=Xanthomonas sp. AM6 TaxID=2982531 RepID=UPI0021D9EFA2|nr:hypothetical protein [Xanthomonas sp. AM6]UYB51175.1 hypothetical protein OCJ37_14390 [Xanthomonas sp. AM6]